MIEDLTLNWMAFTAALVAAVLSILFLKFERKTNSKTIALLGAMTALTVVSRQLMHSLGEFSPVFFLVILAGNTYGSLNGFMVGASTILASNFLLGHGPWTPYQMLGLGLVGFTAGLIPINKKYSRLLLLAYSILSAYAYGFITDVFWWSAFAAEHTLETYAAVASAGIPMDTARAFGNLLFMLFLGNPLLKIMERFKRRFQLETARHDIKRQ